MTFLSCIPAFQKDAPVCISAAAGAPPSIAGVNPLLAGQQVTPQEAVCAAARAMQMKVAAETGIQVKSSYYRRLCFTSL